MASMNVRMRNDHQEAVGVKALETQMNTDKHRLRPGAGISAPAATFTPSYLCSSVFICVSNPLLADCHS
jgi:hypothetical protein